MADTDGQRSSAWPGGITAITLFVDDLEESKSFYERTFGLPIMFQDPDSTVFKFGDLLVNLLKVSAAVELVEPARVAPEDAGSRSVFTLQVDDVDAICADLQTRGVAFLNGPIDRPWGPRTASFKDPSGHLWEVARNP